MLDLQGSDNGSALDAFNCSALVRLWGYGMGYLQIPSMPGMLIASSLGIPAVDKNSIPPFAVALAGPFAWWFIAFAAIANLLILFGVLKIVDIIALLRDASGDKR